MKGFKMIVLAVVIFALALTSLLAQPYSNSPSDKVVIPEVIWAAAGYGGTWVTDIQITIRTIEETNIFVYFEYATGFRGPFYIWSDAGLFESLKIYNILEHLQTYFDPGFDYYGRVGALAIYTENSSHKIFASARTYNGMYSKTVQGLNRYEDANTADTTRPMVIQNLTNNSTYRSAIALWNETNSSLTVNFILVGSAGNTIGSNWTETISGLQYMSFDPFAKAGVSGGTYDNCWLFIDPTSGYGAVMVIGATAHNTSNDPAYHIAVQFNY